MATFPRGSQGPWRMDGWASSQCPTCPSPGQTGTGTLPGAKVTTHPSQVMPGGQRSETSPARANKGRLKSTGNQSSRAPSPAGSLGVGRDPVPLPQPLPAENPGSQAGLRAARAVREPLVMHLEPETSCEPPLIAPHPFPILPGLPATSAPPDSGAPLGPRPPRRPAIR